MKSRFTAFTTTTMLALLMMGVQAASSIMPAKGDWVKYKIMRASEWIPSPALYVTVTAGEREQVEGADADWWQMVVEKEDGTKYVVQALSDHAPMATEDGDLGHVYRYVFRQQGCPALEYTDERSGRAYLPMFGFRDGLVPTPRSRVTRTGPFMATGNFLGQGLAAHENGTSGEWLNLKLVKQLVLNDDLLVGSCFNVKDDGTGQDADREYKYLPLGPEDYDAKISAGFNIFIADDKNLPYLRDRDVFFTKGAFGKGDYPEMLYRANYYGPAMFTDEPAIRMNAEDCRTPQDAANLLRLRNYSYHRSPASKALDFRLTQSDGIVRMIQEAGFGLGDWLPLQHHVPVWETIHESSFYQLEGGAAGIVHEGRYQLKDISGGLQAILGPGAEVSVEEMYDLTFGFMRGAARCFNGEWGTAIYGQADYAIAPQAIRQAYDMGAHYIWFWSADHDHHLTFDKQVELARIIRAHEREHPRTSRQPQLRAAKVAVAIPDGYICAYPWMWGNSRFSYDKLNEFGVAYGDVISEAYYQMYRLAKAGIPSDCVIDVPQVIERAGYDKIIRVGYDARTSLPDPVLPTVALKASVSKSQAADSYQPKPDAPKVVARSVKPGVIAIDGHLSDWAGAQWIRPREQFTYEFAQQKWNGEADLGPRVAFAYDNRFIYITAEVRDDVHVAKRTGGEIWLNDSLQVAFDPLFNPHVAGNYALDDSEIGFSLVDGKPVAYRWTQWIAGPPGEIPGAEVAIVRKGDKTFYEAKVPFSELAPLTPAFPGRCGVNAVVNDADDDVRKGALGWTKGLADGKCPSCFGVLEFAGAEKLSDAPPMAFAQAEKTVVKRGEPILIRVDTGSMKESKAELTVALRSGGATAPPTTVSLTVPRGMTRHEIRLETDSLAADSYRADVNVEAEGIPAVKQTLRVYVVE